MTKKVIHVVAGIIVHGETVFIARRLPGGAAGGKWEFPGGKVESSETPRSALARELKEELELDVHINSQIGLFQTVLGDGTISLDCYWITRFTGQIRLTSHTHFAWARLDELDDYDFAGPDLPVIKEIRRRGLPEEAT